MDVHLSPVSVGLGRRLVGFDSIDKLRWLGGFGEGRFIGKWRVYAMKMRFCRYACGKQSTRLSFVRPWIGTRMLTPRATKYISVTDLIHEEEF